LPLVGCYSAPPSPPVLLRYLSHPFSPFFLTLASPACLCFGWLLLPYLMKDPVDFHIMCSAGVISSDVALPFFPANCFFSPFLELFYLQPSPRVLTVILDPTFLAAFGQPASVLPALVFPLCALTPFLSPPGYVQGVEQRYGRNFIERIYTYCPLPLVFFSSPFSSDRYPSLLGEKVSPLFFLFLLLPISY